jgi:hypothetical protein
MKMDVYLPADFRALHHLAADDWREAAPPASAPAPDQAGDNDERSRVELQYGCADPAWRVF